MREGDRPHQLAPSPWDPASHRTRRHRLHWTDDRQTILFLHRDLREPWDYGDIILVLRACLVLSCPVLPVPDE